MASWPPPARWEGRRCHFALTPPRLLLLSPYRTAGGDYLLIPPVRHASSFMTGLRLASTPPISGSYANPLPSSGGQPALGARNTTLVLRQYLPALNFSLELSLGPRRCTGILSCVHWTCYAPRAGCYPRPSVSRAPRLLFSSLHTCLVAG